jgi:hypothetical protein
MAGLPRLAGCAFLAGRAFMAGVVANSLIRITGIAILYPLKTRRSAVWGKCRKQVMVI